MRNWKIFSVGDCFFGVAVFIYQSLVFYQSCRGGNHSSGSAYRQIFPKSDGWRRGDIASYQFYAGSV